jgi:competence protein ComEA
MKEKSMYDAQKKTPSWGANVFFGCVRIPLEFAHRVGLTRGWVLRAAGLAAVFTILAWFGGRARAGEGVPDVAALPTSVAPTSVPASSGVGPPSVADAESRSTGAGNGSEPDGMAPRAADALTSRPSSSSREATPESPVYLNDATEADLRRLPGIGAKRAGAILALRARLGRFRRVEDLLRVRGIGRKGLQRIQPVAKLDSAAPDVSASSAPLGTTRRLEPPSSTKPSSR